MLCRKHLSEWPAVTEGLISHRCQEFNIIFHSGALQSDRDQPGCDPLMLEVVSKVFHYSLVSPKPEDFAMLRLPARVQLSNETGRSASSWIQHEGLPSVFWEKKKKKLHHFSHIRLIRWTQPVARDIGEHN